MKKKQAAPLGKAEVRKLLNEIRSTVSSTRLSIYQLWEGEAHVAFGCTNFGEFVEKTLGKTIGKSSVYRQLNAAQVERNIRSESQIGDLPESVLRPLTKLKLNDQLKVWKKSMAKCKGTKIPSAKVVKKVVDKMLEGSRSPIVKAQKNTKETNDNRKLKEVKELKEVDIKTCYKNIIHTYPEDEIGALAKQLTKYLKRHE